MGASDRIEAFLVSAVLAVLGIRLYLRLAGYPTIGGEGLHIAHMLWGGLLMLIALVLLLGFLGRGAQWAGAILGGLGFGTFIDEVGKFVTHDNDYFYRPSIAIMHVFFVVTYLVVRRALTARSYSQHEYLLNAIQEFEELALGDLDAVEKTRALRYLDLADPKNPVVQPLRDLLENAVPVPTGPPPPGLIWKRGLARLYKRIVALPVFPTALILFFLGQLAIKLYQAVVVLLFFGLGRTGVANLHFLGDAIDNVRNLPVAGWGELFSSLLATVLTLIGMVRILSSRRAGYYWFQRSVLVSVFLTQVFMFYREQVSAVIGLFFNVSLLVTLNYMIHEEERLSQERAAARKTTAALGTEPNRKPS